MRVVYTACAEMGTEEQAAGVNGGAGTDISTAGAVLGGRGGSAGGGGGGAGRLGLFRPRPRM